MVCLFVCCVFCVSVCEYVFMCLCVRCGMVCCVCRVVFVIVVCVRRLWYLLRCCMACIAVFCCIRVCASV